MLLLVWALPSLLGAGTLKFLRVSLLSEMSIISYEALRLESLFTAALCSLMFIA